jgi:riboflavin kinase/FMN adenylyltransferase
MQVTHGTIESGSGPVGLSIGNFDGVHRGHRAMLERLVARSRALALPACVLTFEPHPREFFTPASAPARLSRLREKLELIGEAGVDRVHVLRFDAQLAGLSAGGFVDSILVAGLQTRWLLVGSDFRFGARRGGDFAFLGEAAARHGFELETMPEVMLDGERVSSSAVRAALAAGRLADASRLLGREYMMSGRVAYGERLGRRLGFPTANIVLRRQPPLAGIFVVEAAIEESEGEYHGGPLRGVASVGRRPTVRDNAPPLLEVHLLDWQGDLYGRHLRVKFLRKLREELKFDGLEPLRAAIARDVLDAKEYFRNHD